MVTKKRHLHHVKVFPNFTCINNDFEATVVQQQIIVTVTHLIEEFRRCEFFALLHNHW